MRFNVESEERISFTDFSRGEALVLCQLVNQSDDRIETQLSSTFIDMHFDEGEAQEIGQNVRDFIMETVKEEVE